MQGRVTPRSAPGRASPGVQLERVGTPCLRADRRHGGTALLPRREDIEAALAGVGSGEVITREQLAARLLRECGGDRVAPRALVAAIREMELAAVARLAANRRPRAAVWRLLRDDFSVDPRSPLKPLYSASQLRAEGHCVAWDRGRWKLLAPGVH